jgi:hypothetical protein
MLVSIRDLSCLSSSGVHNLLAVLLFIAISDYFPFAFSPRDETGGLNPPRDFGRRRHQTQKLSQRTG